MSSKGNQRVKRKNTFSDTKIEPNLKALKKENIIAQFDALKAKFGIVEKKNNLLEKKNISLEKDNKTHIEAINLLEETVKILEIQANPSKVDKIAKEIFSWDGKYWTCNEKPFWIKSSCKIRLFGITTSLLYLISAVKSWKFSTLFNTIGTWIVCTETAFESGI